MTARRRESLSIRETSVGRGVFVRRAFRRHETIGEIRGQIVADPLYSSDYCIDLGDGRRLEPDRPFCYLNHSCEPNCEYFFSDEDLDRLWLGALNSIAPGEQLTIDYAWPAESAIPCRCGSAVCRGWIVNPEELPLLAWHGRCKT